MFHKFKDVVGAEHLTPAELWLASELPASQGLAEMLRVASLVFPYAAAIREAGARTHGPTPPEIYCVARALVGPFMDQALEMVEGLLREWGYEAVAGVRSGATRTVTCNEPFNIYSNWSGRHIAFAAGLETFSLHEGLIAEVGCNMRLGSVVTNAPLEVTPRMSDDPFANCLHFATGGCSKCIDKCPAGAVTQNGHDKQKCREYGRKLREERQRHYAAASDSGANLSPQPPPGSVTCAICQFGVPCTDKNPQAKP